MRTLVCLIALLAMNSAPASAAMMHHHDLASLAYMSTAVVRAVRLDPHGSEPTRYRVREVYAGTATVGDVLRLPTSLYRLGSMAPAFTPSTDTVLFVTQRDGEHYVTPSGLRVVDEANGHVHRFVQMSNPGPYASVRQGSDPNDIRHDNEPSAAVDMGKSRRIGQGSRGESCREG